MMSVRLTVGITFRGLKLSVEGLYYKGYRGSFYTKNGDPGDPPEPPEFDIESIAIEGVKGEFVEFFDQLSLKEYGSAKNPYYTEVMDILQDKCIEEAVELERGAEYDPAY